MNKSVADKLIPAKDFFKEKNDSFWQEMEIESILVGIASQFINYRLDHHLSQKDLARKLDISQSMVSKLESGEYNPSVRLLAEIAQKLGWKLSLKLDIHAGGEKSYCVAERTEKELFVSEKIEQEYCGERHGKDE